MTNTQKYWVDDRDAAFPTPIYFEARPRYAFNDKPLTLSAAKAAICDTLQNRIYNLQQYAKFVRSIKVSDVEAPVDDMPYAREH